MSTDALLAGSRVPFQELSSDDVARAALLLQLVTGVLLQLVTGVGLPLYVMNSVLGEMARRDEVKEQKEEKEEEKRLIREERKEIVRLFVVCLAAACLAFYLKN